MSSHFLTLERFFFADKSEYFNIVPCFVTGGKFVFNNIYDIIPKSE